MSQEKRPFYLPESWLDADGRLCYPAHVLESIPEESEPASSHATSRRGTLSRQSSDPYTATKFAGQPGSTSARGEGVVEKAHSWENGVGENAHSNESCTVQSGRSNSPLAQPEADCSLSFSSDDCDVARSDRGFVPPEETCGGGVSCRKGASAGRDEGVSSFCRNDDAPSAERDSSASGICTPPGNATDVSTYVLSARDSQSLRTSNDGLSIENSRTSEARCASVERSPSKDAGTVVVPSQESSALESHLKICSLPAPSVVDADRSRQWMAAELKPLRTQLPRHSKQGQLKFSHFSREALQSDLMRKDGRITDALSNSDPGSSLVSPKGTTGQTLHANGEHKLPASSPPVMRRLDGGAGQNTLDIGERLLSPEEVLKTSSECLRDAPSGMPAADPADQAAGFVAFFPTREESEISSTSSDKQKVTKHAGASLRQGNSLAGHPSQDGQIADAQPGAPLGECDGLGKVDSVSKVPACEGQNQEASHPGEAQVATDSPGSPRESRVVSTPQSCFRRRGRGDGDAGSAAGHPSALPPLLWLALRAGELSRFLDFSGNLNLSAASKPLRVLLSPWSSIWEHEAQRTRLTPHDAVGPEIPHSAECTEALGPESWEWVDENAYGMKERGDLFVHLEDERSRVLTLCAANKRLPSSAWLWYTTNVSWSHLRVTASWAKLTLDQIEMIFSRAHALVELEIFVSVQSLQRLLHASVESSTTPTSSSPPCSPPSDRGGPPCRCKELPWRKKLMHCLLSAFACFYTNKASLRVFLLHVEGPHSSPEAGNTSHYSFPPFRRSSSFLASTTATGTLASMDCSVASTSIPGTASLDGAWYFPRLRSFCLHGSLGLWCLLTGFRDLYENDMNENGVLSSFSAAGSSEGRLGNQDSTSRSGHLPDEEAGTCSKSSTGTARRWGRMCNSPALERDDKNLRRGVWNHTQRKARNFFEVLSRQKGTNGWMALQAPGLMFLAIADRCGWFDWNVVFPVLALCRRKDPRGQQSSLSPVRCRCGVAIAENSGYDLNQAQETFSVLRACTVASLRTIAYLSTSASSSLQKVSFDFGPPAGPERTLRGGPTPGACSRLSCTCCVSSACKSAARSRESADSDRERRASRGELEQFSEDLGVVFSGSVSTVWRGDAGARRWCGALSEMLVLSKEKYFYLHSLSGEREQTVCGMPGYPGKRSNPKQALCNIREEARVTSPQQPESSERGEKEKSEKDEEEGECLDTEKGPVAQLKGKDGDEKRNEEYAEDQQKKQNQQGGQGKTGQSLPTTTASQGVVDQRGQSSLADESTLPSALYLPEYIDLLHLFVGAVGPSFPVLRSVCLSDAWAAAESLTAVCLDELRAEGNRQTESLSLLPLHPSVSFCESTVQEQDDGISFQLPPQRMAAAWRGRLPELQEVAFVSPFCLCCPVTACGTQKNREQFQSAAAALTFLCDVFKALLSYTSAGSNSSSGIRMRCSSLFLLSALCPLDACCTQRFVQQISPSLVHLLVVFPPTPSVVPLLVSRVASATLFPRCLSSGSLESCLFTETPSALSQPQRPSSVSSFVLPDPVPDTEREATHQAGSLPLQHGKKDWTEAVRESGEAGFEWDGGLDSCPISRIDTAPRITPTQKGSSSAHFVFASLRTLQIVNFYPRFHGLFARASFLWPEDSQIFSELRGVVSKVEKISDSCMDYAASRKDGRSVSTEHIDGCAHSACEPCLHSCGEGEMLLWNSRRRKCTREDSGERFSKARLLLSMVWEEGRDTSSLCQKWPDSADSKIRLSAVTFPASLCNTQAMGKNRQEEAPKTSVRFESDNRTRNTESVSHMLERALAEYAAVRTTFRQQKSFATELMDQFIRKLPPFCLVLPPSGKQTARLLALFFSPSVSSLFSCEISRQRAVQFVVPIRVDLEDVCRVAREPSGGEMPSFHQGSSTSSVCSQRFDLKGLAGLREKEAGVTEKGGEGRCAVQRKTEEDRKSSPIPAQEICLFNEKSKATSRETPTPKRDGEGFAHLGISESGDLSQQRSLSSSRVPLPLVELVVIFRLLTRVALLEQGTLSRPLSDGVLSALDNPRRCSLRPFSRNLLRRFSGSQNRTPISSKDQAVPTEAVKRHTCSDKGDSEEGARKPRGVSEHSQALRREDIDDDRVEVGRTECPFFSPWAERLAFLTSAESCDDLEHYDYRVAGETGISQRTFVHDAHRMSPEETRAKTLRSVSREMTAVRQFAKDEVALKPSASALYFLRQQTQSAMEYRPARREGRDLLQRRRSATRSDPHLEGGHVEKVEWLRRPEPRRESSSRAGSGREGEHDVEGEGDAGAVEGKCILSKDKRSENILEDRERGRAQRSQDRDTDHSVSCAWERETEEETEVDRMFSEHLLAKERSYVSLETPLGIHQGGTKYLASTSRPRVCERALSSRKSEGSRKGAPQTLPAPLSENTLSSLGDGGPPASCQPSIVRDIGIDAATHRRRLEVRSHAFRPSSLESHDLRRSLSCVGRRTRAIGTLEPKRVDRYGFPSFSLGGIAQGLSDKVATWWGVEGDEKRRKEEQRRLGHREPGKRTTSLHGFSDSFHTGENALPVPPRVAVRRAQERNRRDLETRAAMGAAQRAPSSRVTTRGARQSPPAVAPKGRPFSTLDGSARQEGEKRECREEKEGIEKDVQEQSGDAPYRDGHRSLGLAKDTLYQDGSSPEGHRLVVSDPANRREGVGADNDIVTEGSEYSGGSGTSGLVRKLKRDQSFADGQSWAQERFTTRSGAPVHSDSGSFCGQSSVGDLVKEFVSSLTKQASEVVDSAKVIFTPSLRARRTVSSDSGLTSFSTWQREETDSEEGEEQDVGKLWGRRMVDTTSFWNDWNFSSLHVFGENEEPSEESNCQARPRLPKCFRRRRVKEDSGMQDDSPAVRSFDFSSRKEVGKFFGESHHPYAHVEAFQILLIPSLLSSSTTSSFHHSRTSQGRDFCTQTKKECQGSRSSGQAVSSSHEPQAERMEESLGYIVDQSGEGGFVSSRDEWMAAAKKAATPGPSLANAPVVLSEYLSVALSSSSPARTALIRLLRLALPQLRYLLFSVGDSSTRPHPGTLNLSPSCVFKENERSCFPECCGSIAARVPAVSASSRSVLWPTEHARLEQPRHCRLTTVLGALGFHRLEVSRGFPAGSHYGRSFEEPLAPEDEKQIKKGGHSFERAMTQRFFTTAPRIHVPPVFFSVESEIGLSLRAVQLRSLHVTTAYKREPPCSRGGERVRRTSWSSSGDLGRSRSSALVLSDNSLSPFLRRPSDVSSVHYSAVAPYLISTSLSRTMSLSFVISSRLPSVELMFDQANQMGERICGWLSEAGRRGVSSVELHTGPARRLASNIQDAVSVAFRVVAEEVEGGFAEEEPGGRNPRPGNGYAIQSRQADHARVEAEQEPTG
ncbi:aaa family domain atpase [Cystoisospora suis]|uniref:Aaa family domain atpase n=1 Tax=Cystoisospora suis TaxID=483139 RepID=A0A2C6KM47_9APIC|nr:aaa family domain atpase [Cystoisospora suis]